MKLNSVINPGDVRGYFLTHMIRDLFYLLALLFLFSRIGAAEELRFNLRDAITAALANNNELRALESSVSAEKAGIGVTRSFLLPQINVEENFVRTDNPTGVFSIKLNEGRFMESDFDVSKLNNPDPVSNFETDISVEQPVLAVQETLALKSANKEYLAKKEEFGRQREYVAFKVTETYRRVGTAKEFVEVSGKALDDAKDLLRVGGAG